MSAPDVMLQAALAYARHGWPCFVLSATKTPLANCARCRAEHTTPAQMEACTCLHCHGFYAATTDHDRVIDMLGRCPGGLLAIRTGAPSGTVVIDVDPPAGQRTLATLDEARVLPGTVMQTTGRGLHLVYGHPGVRIASGAGRLGPGVDVKADDAYIVVAPSVHPKTGARYTWFADGRFDHPLTPLHPKLVERLGPRPERPRPPVAELARRGGVPPRGRLHGLLETVLGAPAGRRNDTLFWAAACAGEMVRLGQVDDQTVTDVLGAAAAEVGLNDAEARRTIASGLRKGAA